ncbi:MAG TPA: glycerol-3-phosphate 1-O-acyltransferase [Acidimicrobiia bacterium]|nr:glycerol-3-phosphate 1-O-acyltransferase [Acidimicrobiia bacterium]
MSLHAVPPPGDAPWPESGDRPIWFLVDSAGAVERGLIASWLASRRPAGADATALDLPSRPGRPAPAMEAIRTAAESGEDPLLVPIRVAWLSPLRRRRVPRLLDLLTLGDPRDPNRLLQRLILRFRPDRVQVITGEPARLGELRGQWVDARVARPDSPDGFAEYVALQAALALEVTERRLRGNRYKVPRFLREDLLTRASFQTGLHDLARRTGEHVEDLARAAAKYLEEIAATPSTFVLDLVAALIRLVYTQGYENRIVYDEDALRRIEELGRQHSLAYLPSHKSNMDHLALTYVLYENGLPPNHAAGGINMNFFPIGPLLRRHGIFFIRRSFKDNETYKFVLKQYIDYLLSKRFPLEWYLEGGRSRSGKLREPRYGMLSYVADSWRRGSCDDVILVPTSIAYDQIQDVGAHAEEQRGAAKEKESFGWMVRVLRSLRRRYGRIYVNFGEPISLADTLDRYETGSAPDPEESHIEVAKLAFEVAVRINRVTPITPISLVTLALLGTGDRALTVEETHEALRGFIGFVERRGLPTTERLDPDDAQAVRRALDALADHDVVRKVEGGTQTVYAVGPEQALKAAFYRNTIVHFFIDTAIAEMALAAAIGDDDPVEGFWKAVWALRDVLKFEFFFPERDEYEKVMAADVEDHVPGWTEALSEGDPRKVLRSISPNAAHWVLRPILESYLLVADALVEVDPRRDADPKALIKSCLALGEQYRLQRRIASAEAISTVLFGHAIDLARNRGLLGGGGIERLHEREAFAGEIRELVERLSMVEEIALT